MIPLELHLRNFLSHRETDIDFRGLHLATLIGENGAGKSSLLDAITWAVWGRSRAPYGGDENLITHGEDMLEVEYVFRMPYCGASGAGVDASASNHGKKERLFRILRRREQRSRRSVSSVLDFQVQASGEMGDLASVSDLGHASGFGTEPTFPLTWLSLTADSIRDTQARITEQLGLEYDTFINSAYLRQGHADEFTTQSPADRKRVLGTILGLDRWRAYQDCAKQRLSKAKGRLDEVDRRLQETRLELERRPEYEAQLACAEAQAEEASQHLQAIQAQADALTRLQEQASGLRRQLVDLDRRLDLEQEHLHALRQKEAEHQQRLDAYRDQIAHAQEIEAQYKAYQEAVQKERAWVEKLGQAARLQEEKAQLEQRIAQAREVLAERIHNLARQEAQVEADIERRRGELTQHIGDLQGQIRTLEERALGPRLTAQLRQAEADLEAYVRVAEASEQAREALRTSELEIERLRQHNKQLHSQMDEKKAELDKLAEAEAVCPLCRQPLTPAHRAEMLDRIHAEGTAMGDEFRANRGRKQALEGQVVDLRAQIAANERKLQNRSQQEQVVARLRQQIEQGEEAAERLEGLRSKIQHLKAKIADEDYALSEHEMLREVRQESVTLQAQLDQQAYAEDAREALRHTLAQLAELGYDVQAHEAAKARVQALSAAEAGQRELETARMEVHGEESALKQLTGEIEAQAARIARLEETHAELEEELAALKPGLEDVAHIAQLLHQARMQESQARQRVGAARQTLAALGTLEKRLEEYQEQREMLAGRVGIFTELREAFGVNGIPAMIIEHTLPELEREANRILQQLTDGRMHVRFDTQRETKRGTVRETLDIIISDEKGTRPYDNFSGGEKFRVNFAIRVALSRLLAQRAGVQLRSLFVDEGFGALDAEGRQRLVEAVKAVQRDFDLILVITHIEELRDAFPSRIQVTKTESGSQVEVI